MLRGFGSQIFSRILSYTYEDESVWEDLMGNDKRRYLDV